MAAWIERILRTEARRQKVERLALSDEAIKDLAAIGPPELLNHYGKGIRRYLDEATISTLVVRGAISTPNST